MCNIEWFYCTTDEEGEQTMEKVIPKWKVLSYQPAVSFG